MHLWEIYWLCAALLTWMFELRAYLAGEYGQQRDMFNIDYEKVGIMGVCLFFFCLVFWWTFWLAMIFGRIKR
jgi:hypothetical protein